MTRLLVHSTTGRCGRPQRRPVGTYVCADLDCAHRAMEVPPTARRLDEEQQALAVADRAERLRQWLRAFTADVLRR